LQIVPWGKLEEIERETAGLIVMTTICRLVSWFGNVILFHGLTSMLTHRALPRHHAQLPHHILLGLLLPLRVDHLLYLPWRVLLSGGLGRIQRVPWGEWFQQIDFGGNQTIPLPVPLTVGGVVE
jgi:hypothetical protein